MDIVLKFFEKNKFDTSSPRLGLLHSLQTNQIDRFDQDDDDGPPHKDDDATHH